MESYEITFIVRPDLDEEQIRGVVDGVTNRVTSAGGEHIATYPWNPARRRLAYPINDFGDGFYVTTTFRFPSEGLKELERSFRLNDNLLRFLIVQATELSIQQSQQRSQQVAARMAAAAEQQAAAQSGTPPAALTRADPPGAVPITPAAVESDPGETVPVEGTPEEGLARPVSSETQTETPVAMPESVGQEPQSEIVEEVPVVEVEVQPEPLPAASAEE